MALHEIPAETLRDLLLNIDGEISPACPYAFLLGDTQVAPLDPHRAWLKEHGLLDSPPEQDGRLALLPSLRRSLDIVARPIRRILVAEVSPRGARRAVHVSDGAEVVVAMFDQQGCQLSDPVDLEKFRGGLVKAIGPAKGKSAPKPVQLNPVALRLLGAMAPFVRGGSGDGSAGSSNSDESPTPASWPLPRVDCVTRLSALVTDAEQGEQILESLIADRILAADDGTVDIHPAFRPWHEGLSSGHFLEIQRLEFPLSQLQDVQPPIRAYFCGPPGQRCLIWPTEDGSDEVLLSRPAAKDLKSLVGYLVGYIDLK
jgi:hypothetical protein